eukprot:TRINITY_DN1808_c0_g2_i2.p1 TRINITY_DN1808_c0_g2~~TRINITY_DN1808_c0_g2_i2.p1  ORF type:complete len:257 (+),score=29.94 TRINITY_DN1808_c0_g2_i2:118-888(+)
MRPKGFMPLDIASPDTEADDSLHVPSSGAPTHPKQSSRKGELAPDINRFPFCIVWTTLPIISFVFPMIGHTGICNSKGVIHDFAGPYYISVDDFAFGAPLKYVRLNDDPKTAVDSAKWDKGVEAANKHYSTQMHNLFCNNCHSHVAAALNAMAYKGKTNWNMISIWWLCIWKSHYISWGSLLRTYIPFVFVLAIYFFFIRTTPRSQSVNSSLFLLRCPGNNSACFSSVKSANLQVAQIFASYTCKYRLIFCNSLFS